MFSSPLGQHILSYESPRGFFILAFTMFDGSNDPYDHMLHYDQAMRLNADNNRLLCKVFPTSLRGLALAWFHKFLRNSITRLMSFGLQSYLNIFVWYGRKGTLALCRLF